MGVRSALWLAADAGGSSAISLAGTLVSAAIIGPDAVGASAIVLGIVQIVNFSVDALFADVIVQRRRLSRPEINAASWALIGLGISLGIALSLLSPFLSKLYGQPALQPMFIMSCGAILVTAASSVQAALLRRAQRFRTLAIINLIARLLASLIAVSLAVLGFGGWSLVGQYIASSVVTAIALWMFAGWRLRLPIRPQACRGLLRFAFLETASQFLETSRTRLFMTVAALYFSAAAVGEMALAFRIVTSLGTVIGSTAGRLCLALFSRLQNDDRTLRVKFTSLSRTIGMITLPLFASMAVCAPEFVTVAFGDGWLGTVPQIQILSIASGILFCRSTARYLQTAKARPDISVFTGGFMLICTIGLLLMFPPATPVDAMLYWLLPTMLAAVGDVLITRRLFHITINEQLHALLPGLAAAALVVCSVMLVRWVLNREGAVPIAIIAAEAVTVITVGLVLMLTELVDVRRFVSVGRT